MSDPAVIMPLVDPELVRYPFCIVWTPIPLLTWILPFVGHMGIAYSNGVIRDFAGPFHVSENDMAFGNPTRYLQLDVGKVTGGAEAWDRAVSEASDEYKGRMHNLLCDNCHSHVAMAMNLMRYDDSSYNMMKLAAWSFFSAKYTGIGGLLKTWSPFLILVVTVTLFVTMLKF